jgi:hypothetical protein
MVDLRCRHAQWQFKTKIIFSAAEQGLHLSESTQRQESFGGICFTIKWGAASLRPSLGFENFEHTLIPPQYIQMHLLAQRFIFWKVNIEVFWKRECQGLSNGTNVASWQANFPLVCTSKVYGTCRLAKTLAVGFSNLRFQLHFSWEKNSQSKRINRGRKASNFRKLPQLRLSKKIKLLVQTHRVHHRCRTKSASLVHI